MARPVSVFSDFVAENLSNKFPKREERVNSGGVSKIALKKNQNPWQKQLFWFKPDALTKTRVPLRERKLHIREKERQSSR